MIECGGRDRVEEFGCTIEPTISDVYYYDEIVCGSFANRLTAIPIHEAERSRKLRKRVFLKHSITPANFYSPDIHLSVLLA